MILTKWRIKMKINRAFTEYNKEQFKIDNQNQAENTKKTTAAQVSNKATDEVDLSATAQKIDQSKQAEAVDTAKVAALKAAIKDGSYQIDAKAIAGKMMNEIRNQKGK